MSTKNGHIRWSVDPRETVTLSFDDPSFLDALQGFGGEDQVTELRRVLDVEPSDFDVAPFVGDGVRIKARVGIRGSEEDAIANRSQQKDAREGIRVDVREANRLWFSTWVLGVEADELGDERFAKVLEGLSSSRRSARESAFDELPADVRKALIARVRVHTDAANVDAIRDPGKASEPTEGPRAETGSNSSGGETLTVPRAVE